MKYLVLIGLLAILSLNSVTESVEKPYLLREVTAIQRKDRFKVGDCFVLKGSESEEQALVFKVKAIQSTRYLVSMCEISKGNWSKEVFTINFSAEDFYTDIFCPVDISGQ